MASSSAPNILLFLTDDHGAWALSCNGNSEIQSPHLDRLAAQGARFSNAFTPSPVCSPARACLLTGRTPSQVGIHDWLGEHETSIGDRDWLRDETTLPQLLHAQKYFCGLSGKWHLGQSHGCPRGFDWHFGLSRHQGVHRGSYPYVFQNQPLELDGNKTQIITDYALRFLQEAPRDQPFFLNVGYIATHSPYLGQEPELVALYDKSTFAEIPPYSPHPWAKNEGFPDEWAPDECRIRYQNYYAAVTDIDRHANRIIEALRVQKRLDNTIIVYTSDHGCTLGHHGFWGKGNSTRPLNMHETSLRVPLLIRHPTETVPNSTIPQCIDHFDLFQTLCDWAGATPPQSTLGRSFRPLLRGERMNWDDTTFGEYGDLRMIRTPQWKFVKRFPSGPHDLFDLANDPLETRNLANEPALSRVCEKLNAELTKYFDGVQDTQKSGLMVKELPRHNDNEAWRDGIRDARGLQVY
ncbi:MAG: choline-sulfatase [Abditibacteriota bacterium]|nr:choline-sulfatase [Abditibacteriota bacterium]